MTFDWQVLAVAAGAISLRLVAIGRNPVVVRAHDEQLHQKRDGGFYSLQDQAGSQARDCYGPGSIRPEVPNPAVKDIHV